MTYSAWKKRKRQKPSITKKEADVHAEKLVNIRTLTCSQWKRKHETREENRSVSDGVFTEPAEMPVTQREMDIIAFNSVADPESENYDSEFIEKSVYASTKCSSDEQGCFDVPAYDFYNSSMNGELDTGYSDITYEFINGNPDISELIVGKDHNYSYMSDSERSVYNYYHLVDRENGTDYAEKYLNLIQEDLNARAAAEEFKKHEGNTAAELLFAAKSGVHNFGEAVDSWYRQEEGYIAPTTTQIVSGKIRDDLSGNLDLSMFDVICNLRKNTPDRKIRGCVEQETEE